MSLIFLLLCSVLRGLGRELVAIETNALLLNSILEKPPPLLCAIRRIDSCLKTVFPKCRSPPIILDIEYTQ